MTIIRFRSNENPLQGFSPEEQLDRVRLALSLVVFSQGIPFIHAGEEFLRTKQGVENSYRSDDKINGLDWDRQQAFDELTQSLSDMIALRKEYALFRMTEREQAEKHIKFDKSGINQCVSFRLISETEELQVIVCNSYEAEVFYFAPLVTLIFDGQRKVQKEVSQWKSIDRVCIFCADGKKKVLIGLTIKTFWFTANPAR